MPACELVHPDAPAFGAHARRAPALAELLLTIADDEFVIGFWDSEWTGIAPMLEEDVAFSSLSQDEIGHAGALRDAGRVDRRRCGPRWPSDATPKSTGMPRLLDQPRTDWAFTIARRWLYETADAVRLAALARSSFAPLAELVGKVRREERYHLMHLDAWLHRLAEGGTAARQRLVERSTTLWPDAQTHLRAAPRRDGCWSRPAS